jgi:hypothetical protein
VRRGVAVERGGGCRGGGRLRPGRRGRVPGVIRAISRRRRRVAVVGRGRGVGG